MQNVPFIFVHDKGTPNTIRFKPCNSAQEMLGKCIFYLPRPLLDAWGYDREKGDDLRVSFQVVRYGVQPKEEPVC